jgi:pilus assembly protein FimV
LKNNNFPDFSGGAAMNLKLLWALPAIFCLFASTAASALALSDVELGSHLNQPLSAKVRLLAISKTELDSLTVSVRGVDSAQRPASGLVQQIEQDENGHYILISSPSPVREPALTLTLELNWSTGQLSREYDLIIDPR